MLFKFSNLDSNLALTLGYLNPALNNSALSNKREVDGVLHTWRWNMEPLAPILALNRKEKSLRHVAMVAKCLDDNKSKIHLKSKFALFQTSSVFFNFV